MGRWAIINGLLGILVIGLGFGLIGTWTRRLPPIEVGEPAPEPAPAPGSKPGGGSGKGKRGGDKGGAKVDLSPAALVTAIVDHDLFDVTRAKPADDARPVALVPKETNPPPNTVLVGVSILGADREVFLSEGGTVRRFHVGDQVVGYTVKAINADGIDLASPSGDPVTMALSMEKKPTPGQPGAARPVQPGQPPRPAGSPAAGPTAPSPAAGVGGKPVAPPPVPGRPNMPPPAPQAPVAGAPPVSPPPAAPPQPGVFGVPPLPQGYVPPNANPKARGLNRGGRGR